MGCPGTKLAKKQPEPADGETNAHQTQPGTDPGEKGSFCREVHPGILFCRLIHGGILSAGWLRRNSVIRTPRSPAEQLMHAITQLRGIERRPNLHVVVEIDKDIAPHSFRGIALTRSSAVVNLAAPRPGHNTASPGV